MTADEAARYFFVHLQKTAGTTLRFRLAILFGEAALYPGASDRDGEHLTFLVDELLRRVPARADEIRVICGHFPLCTRELLGGELRTLTLLREPVERTLSYLRHHREQTPEDRHRSLEEIYQDGLRFHGLAHNHMTKMLSLTVDEMTDGMLTQVEFTPARLARAKQALEGIDVVGLQESFEEFCDDLRRTFGWALGDHPKSSNRSEPVEVSDSFRARIAADNASDVELYEHAVRLVARRAAAGA